LRKTQESGQAALQTDVALISFHYEEAIMADFQMHQFDSVVDKAQLFSIRFFPHEAQ
jgi:hypothetical protein